MRWGEPVSAVVVAYNSSKTIIQTLESIKNQDYEMLELIITDDCSTDKTVEMVRKWCDDNVNRFISININVQQKNGGVTENFDKGMQLANSTWIKPIAADDILLKDCISNNVKYVIENNCNSIVLSKMYIFKGMEDKRSIKKLPVCEELYLKKLATRTPLEQNKMLLKMDAKVSPTTFINLDMYKNIGGCDRRIKNIEDWSLKLKLTKAGYRINFLDKYTVNYRIGLDSISRSESEMYNQRHFYQTRDLKKLLCNKNIPKWNVIYYYEEFIKELRFMFIVKIMKNKRNLLNRILNKSFSLLLPSEYIKFICNFIKS